MNRLPGEMDSIQQVHSHAIVRSSMKEITPPSMNKILLIDDDENLTDALSVMLERENFLPLLARDAETGFEIALSHKPDLLLVDLRLPGMFGAELCKQLRLSGVQAPIIVLSGMADE